MRSKLCMYSNTIHLRARRSLGGEEVPEDWRGKMNATYRFGDGFQTPGW